MVSVSPDPSSSSATTLYWDIGTLCNGEFKAQIVVRVPITDINYDMAQGVSGEGFVNVHNDYDTHQGPESITNCAYAKADFQPTIMRLRHHQDRRPRHRAAAPGVRQRRL